MFEDLRVQVPRTESFNVLHPASKHPEFELVEEIAVRLALGPDPRPENEALYAIGALMGINLVVNTKDDEVRAQLVALLQPHMHEFMPMVRAVSRKRIREKKMPFLALIGVD